MVVYQPLQSFTAASHVDYTRANTHISLLKSDPELSVAQAKLHKIFASDPHL